MGEEIKKDELNLIKNSVKEKGLRLLCIRLCCNNYFG